MGGDLDSTKKGKLRLKEAVPWKLIPLKLVQSNSVLHARWKIWNLGHFHEKQVQSKYQTQCQTFQT